MKLVELSHSDEDIGHIASQQCQGNLAIVNEKLRQDNAWMEHYGSNADGYTEKLRDKTKADVIEEISKLRKR